MILVLLLLFFLFISANVSSAETALFSLSSITVKGYLRSTDRRKNMIAQLLSNPRDLLVTIIFLNILSTLLVQNVIATLFGDFSTWFLNVGVPLALTVVVGEVIPKSLGLANNEKVALRAAPLLSLAEKVFKPFSPLLIKVTNFVSRCMFFFLKHEEEISIDELQHALRASKQFGVLNEDEAELVYGYLNLKESTVKALMRPREEVLYFDLEEPLAKLVHLFVDQECSRIPICQGGIDKIVGIMTSRLI
ncbi:MAG: CNNM domain-containing protein, partial [Chlamydiales bacterium]